MSISCLQGAEECIRLVRMVGEQDEAAGREARPVVLFNPRMSRCGYLCPGPRAVDNFSI
jgi:hypothetical protein